ncbi:hypothetical protein FWD07_03000 [Candidatus Saccharibacteria bacterium]|nr:hypothetical protein [Candidatus Saccharibacteria bacterium]
MNNKSLENIQDFIANHKRAVAIALCALLILPTIIYFIYMELNYGRLVIVTEGGVGVERVLYGSPSELTRERFFGRSANISKGEYIIDVLLGDGSVYITQVRVRSWIRPTRVRPRALHLEPSQISNRLFESIVPLGDGVVMGYRPSSMPLVHFPHGFRDLNLGLKQVGGACRISDEEVMLIGSGDYFGVTGDYGVSIYNLVSDTYRTMHVTDGRLVNVDVDISCSGDRMYVVDRARRVIFEVSANGVSEIGLRDSELIASASRDLIVSANNTSIAVLYGRDFVDPFSVYYGYIEEVYSDYPHETPPNQYLEETRIVIESRSGGEGVVIELENRDDIFAISLSPNGSYLAVMNSSVITIYNALNGDELYSLPAITTSREDLMWYDDERFLLLTNSAVLVSNVSTRETFSIMARSRERPIQKLSTIHDGYLYFTVNQRMGTMMAAYRVRIEGI